MSEVQRWSPELQGDGLVGVRKHPPESMFAESLT